MPAATDSPGIAVCVAHFLLPDEVQLGLLRSALARADRALVFLTRAHQAPSARHPFGWRERADMLAASLDAAERARIDFEPVREHWSEQRTLRAVQAAAARHGQAARVACLWSGPAPAPEDRPSGWAFEPAGDTDARSGPRLDALYAAHDPLAAWRGIEGELAPGTR